MKTSLRSPVQSIVGTMVLFMFVMFAIGSKSIHAVGPLNTSKLLPEVKSKNKLALNPIPYEIVVEPYELWFTLVQEESASDFITLTLIGDMVVNYQISMPCYGKHEAKSTDSDWLWVYPETGELWPYTSVEVDVFVNALGMQPGLYSECMLVESDDAWIYPVEVMVYLEVLPPVLQSPQNLQAEVVDDVNVKLTWDVPEDMFPIGYNIYRNDEVISTVVDTSFLNIGLITGTYQYKVTALYDDDESEASNAVEVSITDLSQISVSPEFFDEYHDLPQITTHAIIITNNGGSPLYFNIEQQLKNGLDNLLQNDVGVIDIIMQDYYATDTIGPVNIKIKNFGMSPQFNVPVSVQWTGVVNGSFSFIVTDTIPGDSIFHVFTPYSIVLSSSGDYVISACTELVGDENPNNDCAQKLVYNYTHGVCVEGMYSSGCDGFGDGLVAWELSNINILEIPCVVIPPSPYDWYHDYADAVHYLVPGQYELTVQAGYDDTWFDVWIDFNNDNYFVMEEHILDDGFCEYANTPYTFIIEVPEFYSSVMHVMRARTRWQTPVFRDCLMYSYGNCTDFRVLFDEYQAEDWLSVFPASGIIGPQETLNIIVVFNSTGLPAGLYEKTIVIHSNDPNNPTIEVPVTLHVEEPVTCPPPRNLVGSIINEDEVLLQWEPPMMATYLQWDDGMNGDAIGLAGVYDWQVAARWEGSDLVSFAGMYLTAVDFFPTSTMGAEYIIKVWKGENAGTLMTEQLVENYTPYQWNAITLENPVLIDTTQELWIGYHIEEFEVGDYPAGIDSGPAIAGYGDMISFNAIVWESMSINYGLDYNWNIAGILSAESGGRTLAKAKLATQVSNQAVGEIKIITGNSSPPEHQKTRNTKDELLGYNIYRDAMQLNISIVPDTFFIDQLQPPGSYEYFVTAVYVECESEPSNTVSIIAPPPAPEIAVYPLEFVFELQTGITIEDVMNISNIGYDTLEYSISISFETGLTDDDWLIIEPLSGSLPDGQVQPHNLQVNANELIPGAYYATISITTNDPNNPEIEIPVTLDVITSIEEYQNSGIQLFPNPAKDELFIQSNKIIKNVRMLSHLGEVLMEKEFTDSEIRLDVSILKPGVYIVEIETVTGKAVRKLVVCQ